MESHLKSSSSYTSVFITLIIFMIYSNEIHSQYFDIGESNSSPSALKGAECFLPSTWEGNWFQSGVHSVISINKSIISTKGQCIEADGDKFLFFNALDSCFRCVVFHEKHSNVLQYKETYCHPSRRSLPHTCSTIQADFHLISMFRVDGAPVECPFRGPFTVSYNRGQGNCEYPMSTLDSCIHPSRVVLNYQACPNVPGTESTTEEIECFATWRESSSRYLLGLIRYHYPASYEERFRCFVYEKANKFGTLYGRGNSSSGGDDGNVIFRVAQSGDATCLGLSPNEGAKTLVLKRAIHPKPCQFPSWLLKHTQWLSLNQKLVYAFEQNTLRLSNYSSTTAAAADPVPELATLLTLAVCTQIIQHPENASTIPYPENLTDKITLVLHSTTECQIGYTCMVIHKRENHIIELQSGKLSRTIENACHQSNFDPTQLPFITLTSPTPESRECPYLANFDISSLSLHHKYDQAIPSNCQHPSEQTTTGTFSMGCSNMDLIELQSNNKCLHHRKIIEKYTCLGWWEEAEANYLVVSSTSATNTNSSLASRRNQRFCFVFHETTQQLSSLTSTSSRKSQEISPEQNDDDDDEHEHDGRENDHDGSSLVLAQESQQQLRKNLKRQFHFTRYDESCERRTTSQLSGGDSSSGDVHDIYDGGDLVFDASTNLYENSCLSMANSGGKSQRDGYSGFTFTAIFIISLLLTIPGAIS